MKKTIIFTLVFTLFGSAVAGAQTKIISDQFTLKTVWVVFFHSKDCPKCDDSDFLISALSRSYPLKVKKMDVEDESVYKVFRQLESIHSAEKFSVPLVIVGEDILVGDGQIRSGLEKKAKSLSETTGAKLPYLGEGKNPNRRNKLDSHSLNEKKVNVEEPSKDSDCNCNKKGRPPELSEELNKVRKLMENAF